MSRQTGLILTIVTAIICGCPGFFTCFWGMIASVVSFIPNADIDIGGSSDPMAALIAGLGAMCLGVILMLLPLAVWYFTMRGKSV
jgi:hypothetical protein